MHGNLLDQPPDPTSSTRLQQERVATEPAVAALLVGGDVEPVRYPENTFRPVSRGAFAQVRVVLVQLGSQSGGRIDVHDLGRFVVPDLRTKHSANRPTVRGASGGTDHER